MLKSATGLLELLASPAIRSGEGLACLSEAGKRGFKQFVQESRNGPVVKPVKIEDEWYNRHRNFINFLGKRPWVLGPNQYYIAPTALVCGDVDLHHTVAVFNGAVLRGDLSKIKIHETSVILDKAVLTTARAVPTGMNPFTVVKEFSVIEPYATLRACKIGSRCIIGARSVVCEGAVVEDQAFLAPGSVLPPGRLVPSGELWGGNPARFIRPLTEIETEWTAREAAEYWFNVAWLLGQETLQGPAWRKIEAWREKQVAGKEYQWINFREQKYMMKLQHEAESLEKLVA